MPPSIATQVAVLIAAMERMEQQLKEDRQERKATQDKTELAREVFSDDLHKMRTGQDDILRRLGKIEPVTDLVTSLWAKMIGAVSVLGVLGAILWGGIVFFKDIIVGWFQ